MDEKRFRDLLRKKGLKVTGQRLLVLDVMDSHPKEHLTAEEIYGFTKERWPEIGIATIYRTVQVLCELQILDKVDFDDGYARYELCSEDSASGHRHHHAICTGCGKVYSLDTDLLDSLEEQVYKNLGFQVTDHEVKLYGLCRECRKKDGNGNRTEKRERKNNGGCKE